MDPKLAGEEAERAERIPHAEHAIVFIDHATSNDVVRARARDISASGVFLEATAPVKVGDQVSILLAGVDNRALRVVAQVTRVTAEGFGARFLAEEQEERETVERFVARVRDLGRPRPVP